MVQSKMQGGDSVEMRVEDCNTTSETKKGASLSEDKGSEAGIEAQSEARFRKRTMKKSQKNKPAVVCR